MKIWFDVLTPKQVMFFKPAVDLLVQSGHKVLCTSRMYREAVELAKIIQLDIKIVGRHGGAERYDKLLESSKRVTELAQVIKQYGPDVAVTFSSPEGARVAFGLGIKHVGFNDSPHATAVAKLTVPLMDCLLCPWIIPHSAWTGFGITRKKIFRYRALDPAAWLKRASSGKPDPAAQMHFDPDKKNILIRLEEIKASYIADSTLTSINVVDRLVNGLSKSANVLILCRYEDQIEQMSKRYSGRARVVQKVVDGTSLIRLSDVFLGAGGTMTAEAALMGKPTLSIAPVRSYVEKYLIKSGLVKRAPNSRMLLELVEKMAGDKYRSEQEKKARRILAGMEDPAEKMVDVINNIKI